MASRQVVDRLPPVLCLSGPPDGAMALVSFYSCCTVSTFPTATHRIMLPFSACPGHRRRHGLGLLLFLLHCLHFSYCHSQNNAVWRNTTQLELRRISGLSGAHGRTRGLARCGKGATRSPNASPLSPFLTGRMLTLFAEHTSDSSTNYDSFLN